MKKSFASVSLKRRIWIAISLTTFLPFIILVYYFSNLYISAFTIFILIMIVFLGWFIIFEVFSSILNIYNKSKAVLPQAKTKGLSADGYIDDEVECLSTIFNALTFKVKESVDELKAVSCKIEELNKRINQKANVLSSILQANTLFSKQGPGKNIFQFLTEHLKGIVEANVVISFFKKEQKGSYDFFFSGIEHKKVDIMLESENFNNFFTIKDKIIIDGKHKAEKFSFLLDLLDLKNVIVNPIRLREQVIGCIVAGNCLGGFAFSADYFEIAELFSRNMSIVWEQERLSRRVEDLEMFDPLTGVYNDKFFFARLDEEIKRAISYQRPCGFLMIEIINYNEYQQNLGLIELEKILKRIVRIFKENVGHVDILGRIRDNRIGAVLIERNKRQSYYIGEKIRQEVLEFLGGIGGLKPQISFAVAENPVDGTDAAQLVECVENQIKSR